MSRFLLTYAGLLERKRATHWAVLLNHRGIDVDLASVDVAASIKDERYARVFDTRSTELALLTSTLPVQGEGTLRIVGAPADLAPPPAVRRSRVPWVTPAGIVLGLALLVAGASIGVPPVLLVVYGLITAAAATHLFGVLASATTAARRNVGSVALAPLVSRHTGAA